MGNEWTIANLYAATGGKTKGHLEMPTIGEKLPAFLINGEVHSNTSGVVLFLVSSLAIDENDPLLAVGA